MIAVLIPTRGMVFSRVVSAIEKVREKEWMDFHLFISDFFPIPEAHNKLVGEALDAGATHFWFVEEDVIVTDQMFRQLMATVEDISFVDYSVNGNSCCTRDRKGNIMWAGLGNTMIKRHVFEGLEKPWFRTDKSLRLNDMKWIDVPPEKQYGQQDIWFFRKAIEAGFSVRQIEGESEHLQLKKLGSRETNNGLHTIVKREPITKHQVISL